MALWWEWDAESLWISRVVGFRAAVIWFVVSLGRGGEKGRKGADFEAHAVFDRCGGHS